MEPPWCLKHQEPGAVYFQIQRKCALNTCIKLQVMIVTWFKCLCVVVFSVQNKEHLRDHKRTGLQFGCGDWGFGVPLPCWWLFFLKRSKGMHLVLPSPEHMALWDEALKCLHVGESQGISFPA